MNTISQKLLKTKNNIINFNQFLQNKKLNFTLKIIMIILFLCGFMLSTLPKESLIKRSFFFTLIGLEFFSLFLECTLYTLKNGYRNVKNKEKRKFLKFLCKEAIISLNFINIMKRGITLGIFLEGFKLGS